MAKRKLSLQQRQTVRKDIQKYLSQKKKSGEILKAIAEKYGVSTITARWYLKSVQSPGKAVSSRKPKAKAQQRRRKATVFSANGASMRIIQQIQSVAEKSLERAREVKKLLPKWQIFVKKEGALRHLQNRVQTQLRAISSKVSKLRRKLESLTTK